LRLIPMLLLVGCAPFIQFLQVCLFKCHYHFLFFLRANIRIVIEIRKFENTYFVKVVISNFAPPSFRKVEQPLIRKVEQPE
jgi:hypothetical protein